MAEGVLPKQDFHFADDQRFEPTEDIANPKIRNFDCHFLSNPSLHFIHLAEDVGWLEVVVKDRRVLAVKEGQD